MAEFTTVHGHSQAWNGNPHGLWGTMPAVIGKVGAWLAGALARASPGEDLPGLPNAQEKAWSLRGKRRAVLPGTQVPYFPGK